MSAATETKPDARVSVAGHPEGEAVLRFNDALIEQMTREEMHDHMQRVILVDVGFQQRIAALENALKILISNFGAATMEIERTGDRAALDAVNWQAKVILANLGLAHRVWGNPTEAERAVSS